jgi:hypothetical protein
MKDIMMFRIRWHLLLGPTLSLPVVVEYTLREFAFACLATDNNYCTHQVKGRRSDGLLCARWLFDFDFRICSARSALCL